MLDPAALAPNELIVDLFAGGGGASQGIYQATGRHPDIAINHDPAAVAVHARNHPGSDHRCVSVWAAEPRSVCAGRPVGLLWALFGASPWRPAASIIDWSLPCPSIFTRKRPLKEATMRRIAQGMQRYVIGTPDPFIVRIGHWSNKTGEGMGFRGQPLSRPLATETTVNDKALIVPHVSSFYGTSTGHHALVAAHLAPITHQGENRGSSIRAPLPTITCAPRGEQALISAFLAQHNGNGVIGRDAREPVATITGTGSQTQLVEATLSEQDREGAARVAAFLVQYYSNGKQGQDLREPLGTIRTHGSFALVMVDGVRRPIVDIGMRMLALHELAAAQSFPADYDLLNGGRLSKTTGIRLVGNSVCPDFAAAIVRAAFRLPQPQRQGVAA